MGSGGGGRGVPFESGEVAVSGSPWEQFAYDVAGLGMPVILAAAIQVFVEGREGVEAEASAGDAQDEGMRSGAG